MVDPTFLEALRVPDLAPPEVLDREESGTTVRIRTRYQYTGGLDSLARRVLKSADINWVQDVVLDRSTHTATFSVVPKVHSDRLDCSGTYTLVADGDGTRRTIAGHLKVHVPMFAGRAEKMIGGGMVTRLKKEAEFLDDWLARPSR